MTDINNARQILEQGGYTCVLCKEEKTLCDTRRGVKPLLELLDSGKDLAGYSAADKVVGKAAAHLYLLMGVRAVWAGIISIPAKQVLEKNGIAVTYGTLVPHIKNRAQTGLCPMEQAVWEISDTEQARQAILETLSKL